MAPMPKIEEISKGQDISTVNISDVTIHKTVSSDSFLGFYAVHSVAKMAYEWYCYVNHIEELINENSEIVNYILGKSEVCPVDIIIDGNYYAAIDQLSEVGTNAFFQYDDIDGYRYVIFDLWKTISYRVKICKSPDVCSLTQNILFFKLYLYHVDGSKSETSFGVYSLDDNKKAAFVTIQPQDMTVKLWKVFVSRIEMIMSTMVLSINILKREVDSLHAKLKKYDEEKIDIVQLLGFEENNVVTVIDIITQLFANKNRYDPTKTFNQNLPLMLNLSSDTIAKSLEEKKNFVIYLVGLDKKKELSDYIRNGISIFYEMFENEERLTKQ